MASELKIDGTFLNERFCISTPHHMVWVELLKQLGYCYVSESTLKKKFTSFLIFYEKRSFLLMNYSSST